MESELEYAILERLDLIIRVLAIQVGADQSLTERVRLLKAAGLDNKTIAQVLNTSPAAVRALLSSARSLKPQTARRRKRG